MPKRRGRPRKSGKRYPGGQLKRESPREVAAAMPHRRWLGHKAVDQLAESELGRLVLRGHLDGMLALAGDYYAARWRGYVATLDAPRRPSGGHTGVLDCGGCGVGSPDRDFCMCEARKRLYLDAMSAILDASGPRTLDAVDRIAVGNFAPRAETDLEYLRLGLSALANHFGLTQRADRAMKIPVLKVVPSHAPADG